MNFEVEMKSQKEQTACIDIDDMEIMRTIGKGKTCTVKTAKLPNSDKVYAIKQFKSYASAI